MRLLSLFSGIGAFEEALNRENIDWELDHYCEIDKFASQSYNMIHGTTDKDNLKDVTKIDYNQIGDIDLLTFGFPCQDISLAGELKGFFDENGNKTRSGLFFDSAEIINKTRPKFAIFENVKNLTSKKFSKEFEVVLSTMNEIGYDVFWKVLNAKDFGVPQNRERIYGICIRKDISHGFEFPKGFFLKYRLKDLLEKTVDDRYQLSEKIVSRFKWLDPTMTKSIIGTTAPEFRTIGQRDLVYQQDSIMGSLVATDYKQPKQILDFINKKDDTGMSYIEVPENTKRGFKEAYSGDSVNLEQPSSKTRRGRVGFQVAQTLTTSCQQGVVVNEPTICASRGRYTSDGSTRQNLEINPSGCSNTLTTVQKDNYVIECKNKLTVRKLTPRECWRLMGFGDQCFDKISGISDTQLYKQAGNSIVVNVLQYIFRSLHEQYPEYFVCKK